MFAISLSLLDKEKAAFFYFFLFKISTRICVIYCKLFLLLLLSSVTLPPESFRLVSPCSTIADRHRHRRYITNFPKAFHSTISTLHSSSSLPLLFLLYFRRKIPPVSTGCCAISGCSVDGIDYNTAVLSVVAYWGRIKAKQGYSLWPKACYAQLVGPWRRR